MGPVAKAVLFGCLRAVAWMLWLAAALLLILVAVQYGRGDANANPALILILAAAFGLVGIIAEFAARKVAAIPERD